MIFSTKSNQILLMVVTFLLPLRQDTQGKVTLHVSVSCHCQVNFNDWKIIFTDNKWLLSRHIIKSENMQQL